MGNCLVAILNRACVFRNPHCLPFHADSDLILRLVVEPFADSKRYHDLAIGAHMQALSLHTQRRSMP
jgi:hypothetical protein